MVGEDEEETDVVFVENPSYTRCQDLGLLQMHSQDLSNLLTWTSSSFLFLVDTQSTALEKTVSSPTVSRLTDTSKFTGSHKERFDASGKGKGRAGREDLVDNSGYVSGYKHAGTYDHKVQGNK
ncbi:hypothetical protein EK904_006325 [Melospiza melodia maxima]|nr:hypothetical protein EK904_006325 [Melospiza melodia maxima]